MKNNRITEIDFIKFVMITLMVAFHLVFIGDTYPVAKCVVYAFHMPCFLLISGYVCNATKKLPKFLETIMWLAIPYIVMESAYIFGASIFNIREHIDNLTLQVFLDHLFINPLGPYWYLHTLIICTSAAWGTNTMVNSLFKSSGETETKSIRTNLCMIIAFATIVTLISSTTLITQQSAIYFSLGFALKTYHIDIRRIFSHPCIATIVVVVFYLATGELEGFLHYNIAIVLFAMTICTTLCQLCNSRKLHPLLTPLLFIGRNTLAILLFSPIFTILAKSFLPFTLTLDESGMLFLCLALPFSIGGSLLIAWFVNKTGLNKPLPCFALK